MLIWDSVYLHFELRVPPMCRKMKYGSDSTGLREVYGLRLIVSPGNIFLRTVTWLCVPLKSFLISPQKFPMWRNFSRDMELIINLNCASIINDCDSRSNVKVTPIC